MPITFLNDFLMMTGSAGNMRWRLHLFIVMGERRENMEGVGSEGGGCSGLTLPAEPADY